MRLPQKKGPETPCVLSWLKYRTWKLWDWMEVTEHLEVTGFVESCVKGCAIMEPLSQGAALHRDSYLVSAQGRIKQSFVSHWIPLLTFPWLPNTLTYGSSAVTLPAHFTAMGQAWLGPWAAPSIEGEKSSFPVERGETQQRDYEGVSHRVPSAWLWGQGGLLFRGWGKVTASPVIIVSHNPSYTKSSRNHTCKCLNLKCKINTRKIAATCFL